MNRALRADYAGACCSFLEFPSCFSGLSEHSSTWRLRCGCAIESHFLPFFFLPRGSLPLVYSALNLIVVLLRFCCTFRLQTPRCHLSYLRPVDRRSREKLQDILHRALRSCTVGGTNSNTVRFLIQNGYCNGNFFARARSEKGVKCSTDYAVAAKARRLCRNIARDGYCSVMTSDTAVSEDLMTRGAIASNLSSGLAFLPNHSCCARKLLRFGVDG